MGEQLATIRTYDDLVTALRGRVHELRACCEDIDAVAGLPVNYTAKLLGPIPARALGRVSLGPLLAVLGCRLVLEADGPVRLTRRNAKRVMPTEGKPRRKRASSLWDSESARLARARGVLKLGPKRLRALARHAAVVRWRNARKAARGARRNGGVVGTTAGEQPGLSA
jgi:hypothetical protein